MNLKLLIFLCIKIGIGVYGKTSRILGGQTVTIEEFPYLASLRNYMPDYHFCTGSIITVAHILTAGHCVVFRKDLLDRMRVHTGVSNPSPRVGKAHKVASIEIHPAYDVEFKSSNHDLAIITLTENLVFDQHQNRVLLPITNSQTGNTATILGWGYTTYPSMTTSESLQKIQARILTPTRCKKFYEYGLHKQQLCAMDKEQVGICYGDGGAPLIINGRIAGIASYNLPCGIGYPDVFLNVFDYVGFIKFITEPKPT